MTQTFEIAVIGATGTVGETLVQILEELEFPVGTLYLLAGSNSAGLRCRFGARTCGSKKSTRLTSARCSWRSSPQAQR